MRETDWTGGGGILAMRIAGVGQAGTEGAKSGILFCTPAALEYQAVLGDSDIWPWLVPDSLQPKSHRLEYFASRTQYSQIDFAIEATYTPGAKVFGDADQAVTAIESDVAPEDTTIDLQDAVANDTAVWVGKECILLGTNIGAGIYSGCTRGYYQSTPEAHSAAANVYDEVPGYESRQVYAYDLVWEGGPTIDGSGDPTEVFRTTKRWEGKIVNGPEQDQGRIVLKSYGTFGADNGSRQVFQTREPDNAPRVTLKQFDKSGAAIAVSNGSIDYEVKSLKTNLSDGPGGGADIKPGVAFVVEGEVIPFPPFVAVAGQRYGWDRTNDQVSFATSPAFGRDYDLDLDEDTQSRDAEKPYYEVMIMWRERGYTPVAWQSNTTGDSPRERYFYFHPLAMWAAINLSTARPTPASGEVQGREFDLFRPDWSTNNKRYYVDNIVDRVKTLIRATPEYQMDQFVLGYEQQPQNLREISRRLFLRPWGFAEAPTKNGEVDLVQATTIDVEDYDDALDNKIYPVASDVLNQDSGREHVLKGAEIKVGGLPMDGASGKRAKVLADDNDADRSVYINKKAGATFDFSTVNPDRLEWVKQTIVDSIALQAAKIPRLTVQVDDWEPHGLDYSIGEAAHLEALDIDPAWLWDRDGNRVSEFGDDIQWAGIIQERRWLATKKAYVLTLLLVAQKIARWRAPSGRVNGVSTNAEGERVLALEGSGGEGSAFGLEEAGSFDVDAAYFTVGDDLEFWNRDGTLWGGNAVAEVTAVDAAAHTITLDGSLSSDPPVGTIVELASLDSDGSGTGYQNDGLDGTFSNIGRAYFYLADTAATLGDAGLEADVYGG